ncbi:MAG: arginase [Candidatus Levybacteria bacterium]|nr:arginase [Candidatus Levybacteria bacterium]MDZ4227771.1 arginase [Candidatus Levybacteria bacterium]
MKLNVLGVPLDLGAQRIGVDKSPQALRQRGFVEKLSGVGISVEDMGDISCNFPKNLNFKNPNIKYVDEIIDIVGKSMRHVEDVIKNNEKIVVLGGDHSITLGNVSGASKALDGNLGLIYIDAHGDLNTDKTTTTGNIHGMPLAALMGFGNNLLTSLGGFSPKIKKDHMLHIGGKDFDKGELDLIQNEKLNLFTVFDILSYGLSPLLKKIKDLQCKTPKIWVSFDLDVVDKIYAPGVGIANNGGLTYREIAAITEYIGKNCNVIGADIVEYNPTKDIGNKTAELAIEIAAKLFGSDYSDYTKYLDYHSVK